MSIINLKDSLTGGLHYQFMNDYVPWKNQIGNNRRVGICSKSNRLFFSDGADRFVVMRTTGQVVRTLSPADLNRRCHGSDQYMLIRPEAVQDVILRDKIMSLIDGGNSSCGVKFKNSVEIKKLFDETFEFKGELL